MVLVADDDATPDVGGALRMSRRTVAIASACAGGFLAFLDTTIVNTAFPDIAASFDDAGPSELSWILDAYFIVMAALLVPAGAIADRIGRKRVFVAGLRAVRRGLGCCARSRPAGRCWSPAARCRARARR